MTDTTPAPPPTDDELPTEVRTGKLPTGLEALAHYVERVDYLTDEVRGLRTDVANAQLPALCARVDALTAAVQDLRAAFERRPPWADDVLAAVTTITPARAISADVESLRARVSVLEERCEACPGRAPDSLPSGAAE